MVSGKVKKLAKRTNTKTKSSSLHPFNLILTLEFLKSFNQICAIKGFHGDVAMSFMYFLLDNLYPQISKRNLWGLNN